MLADTSEIDQSLQPPGAGLPRIELWFARAMVAWGARRATRDSSAASFARERDVICGLEHSGTPEANSQRVLIRRLPGMEDSSRHWSVYMTLDHLRIVNGGTANLIRKLGRGELPQRMTGTADVKPSPLADGSVVEAFQQSCAQLEQSVAALPDLRTPLRWPHPWFGPLDAGGWHYVMAFHMRIHRRQIEAIRSALPERA
jgi:hypothetical protein